VDDMDRIDAIYLASGGTLGAQNTMNHELPSATYDGGGTLFFHPFSIHQKIFKLFDLMMTCISLLLSEPYNQNSFWPSTF
jgi:hypothetical protein